MNRVLLVLAFTTIMSAFAVAQVTSTSGDRQKILEMGLKDDMGIFSPAKIKWVNGPASLPTGAKLAVLEGDPAKEGFFTMRLWLPDGFKVPPHWHPKVEHVTVISGTFNLGMGEKFDQKDVRAMPAGTFGFWEAGMRHFAWAKGETVIQLHGIGPWTITYVDPSDDPRNKKK